MLAIFSRARTLKSLRLSKTQPGRIHSTDASLTLEPPRGSVEGSGSATLGADLGRFLLLLDRLRHGGTGPHFALRDELDALGRNCHDEIKGLRRNRDCYHHAQPSRKEVTWTVIPLGPASRVSERPPELTTPSQGAHITYRPCSRMESNFRTCWGWAPRARAFHSFQARIELISENTVSLLASFHPVGAVEAGDGLAAESL